MSNKNLAQFTEVGTADQTGKWLVGYDTTTGSSREVKYKLDYFVTTDTNGVISPKNSGTFRELIVNNTSKDARFEVSGTRNCYIDLKRSFGSDFDLRIAAAGTGPADGLTGTAIYTNNKKLEINSNPLILQDQQPTFKVGISVPAPTEKLDVAGNIKASGAFISTAPSTDHGQLRCVAGNRPTSPGIIHRNDGENYYIIQTNPNDPMGVWSNENKGGYFADMAPLPLRNFAINLTGYRDTWMTAPLNVYNTIGANNLFVRRQNAASEGGEIVFFRSSDNTGYWANDVHGPSADPSMRWHNRGVVRLTLDANGNLTAAGDVSAFSDAKLKTNVKTIEGALGKVNALRGVEFEKISTGEKCVGVIAQEVEAVIPQVVGEVEGTKTVAYGNLVGVLIEAVKELTAEVEALKAQINK